MWSTMGNLLITSLPAVLLCAAVAYLLGSFNSAIVVCRLMGREDVRNCGSGNAGATNMLRSQGKLPALLTTVGDLLKTVAAVLLGQWFLLTLGNAEYSEEMRRVFGSYIAGGFCILGHLYPLYFGFRGGKGVATLVGAVTGIYPPVALLCFGVWFVMLMVSHYVSLSSMVAGCCFPVFTLISPKVNGSTPFVVFSFVIAVLLIYTHRKNIERLKAGTESKIYIWKPRRMNPGDGAERKDKDHGPK